MSNIDRFPPQLRAVDDGSVLSAADCLAHHLGADPIEKPQPVERPVHRPRKQEVWPADEWARMQRIWRGEEE